ncbi:MAG: TonB-dependent receptor [Haliangiales bacterium]
MYLIYTRAQRRYWRQRALAALLLSILPAAALAQPAPPSSQQRQAVAPAGAPQLDPAPTPQEPRFRSLLGRRAAHPDTILFVFDRDDIIAAGVTSLGDFLQKLPLQSNAINTQFNSGGSGATRVALRGLGAERTVVLVNGRRHIAGGDGADASVDLNSIALASVERVEIIAGTSSALYGAGALGGVVNIVTRHGISGVSVDASIGRTSAGDGLTYNLSAVTGAQSPRGGVTVGAEYVTQEAIAARDREFSRFDRSYQWDRNDGSFDHLGSVATPAGTLIDVEGSAGNAQWQQVAANDCTSGICYRDPITQSWRNFDLSGLSDTGEGDRYNYAAEQHLVTPSERYHLFASGDYRVHRLLRGFFEATYARRESELRFAPEPLFTSSEGITVAANNLYNPFGRDFSWMARRMVEGGERRFTQQVDTIRALGGVGGDLSSIVPLVKSLSWQASYSFGRSDSDVSIQGRYLRDRVADALGPSFIMADGTPACGTPDSPIAGCVPLNFFGGAGTITPEMLNYIQHTGSMKGANQQHELAVNVHSTLARSDSGVGAAITAGAASRTISGSLTPDRDTQMGTTTGNRIQATEGDDELRSVHAELALVPVAGVPGAERVELSAAARTFRYRGGATGNDWQLGASWHTGIGLGIRGGYAIGSRAPSLSERFAGQSDTFPTAIDPCNRPLDPNSSDPVTVNCLSDGVPVSGSQDPSSQILTRTGGNPDLNAETATSLRLGVMLASKQLPGWSVGADYFDITLENQPGVLSAQQILERCYARAERSNCDLVIRNADGQIDHINATVQNVGHSQVRGIDLSVRGAQQLAVGRVDLQVLATRLLTYEQRRPDGAVIDGLGVYDLGVRPTWSGYASASFTYRGLTTGANLRYIHSFRECGNNNIEGDCFQGTNPDGSERLPPPDDSPNGIVYSERTVAPSVTTDLFVRFALTTGLGASQLTLGVNNVLDRDPPLVYTNNLTRSDASAYDFQGRYAYLRASHSF